MPPASDGHEVPPGGFSASMRAAMTRVAIDRGERMDTEEDEGDDEDERHSGVQRGSRHSHDTAGAAKRFQGRHTLSAHPRALLGGWSWNLAPKRG